MTANLLQDMRREIDGIDDAIHDLIMKRADLVLKIGAAKQQAGDSGELPVRLAREMAILRRLLARHRPPLPHAAITRIWHEIMAAAAQMQAPYTVAVVSNAAHGWVWDLARNRFGSQTPLTAHKNPREALSLLFDRKAGMAVLPVPQDDDDAPWWPMLDAADPPKIVMRLPYGGVAVPAGQPDKAAFVVARMAPEKWTSADDMVSLLMLATTDALSRDGMRQACQKAGLPAEKITVDKNAQWAYLVEVGGLVDETDARLTRLGENLPLQRMRLIGQYPKITIPAMPATKGQNR